MADRSVEDDVLHLLDRVPTGGETTARCTSPQPRAPGGRTLPPFAADTLTNYEIGWKTSWLDRQLYVNGAIFWEQWNKIQYSEPGILGIFYTVNAGDARSRGFETQVLWRPTPATTLTLNGTYADARLTTSFCNQQFGCDPANGGQLLAPAGTPLRVTPRSS